MKWTTGQHGFPHPAPKTALSWILVSIQRESNNSLSLVTIDAVDSTKIDRFQKRHSHQIFRQFVLLQLLVSISTSQVPILSPVRIRPGAIIQRIEIWTVCRPGVLVNEWRKMLSTLFLCFFMSMWARRVLLKGPVARKNAVAVFKSDWYHFSDVTSMVNCAFLVKKQYSNCVFFTKLCPNPISKLDYFLPLLLRGRRSNLNFVGSWCQIFTEYYLNASSKDSQFTRQFFSGHFLSSTDSHFHLFELPPLFRWFLFDPMVYTGW